MTPKLPNKLSPLHEPSPHNTALATDRNLTRKVNDLIQAHNELVEFVAFGQRMIEELHRAPNNGIKLGGPAFPPKERYHDDKESTASDQRNSKDIKGGK